MRSQLDSQVVPGLRDAASYASRRTAASLTLMVPPSYGCQPDVDGPCSQVAIFEMKSVTENDRLVKRQSRSGAIPSHKLIDRMPITALRFERPQAYDHGDLGILQIGKAELCFQSGMPAFEFALHG